MNRKRIILSALAATGLLAIVLFGGRQPDKELPETQPKPALTVVVTQPQISSLPLKVAANGNVAAWQEASIGTEANGLRLSEVLVNVGDHVESGQLLAAFSADQVQADLAQARAEEAEAEAMLAEASANAERARSLQPRGVMSAQQVVQYLTAERTAQARLEAKRAKVQEELVRLQQTKIHAPDRGIISARNATVGAVLPAGQELFRMIRQGRLEWRAEVSSDDLALIKPGIRATVTSAGGTMVKGIVRKVAPTVDARTRNGLVYVDLPSPGSIKAGMFASGEFEIGSRRGLTLPQSAVLLRDGFSYVLRVGPDLKVTETKVSVGRRTGDRIELLNGVDASARVVASGGSFLADGDTVRLAENESAASKAVSQAVIPGATVAK